MKLSTIAVDPKAIEDGEWVKDLPEMGDLELKCRGQNSVSWRRLQRRLIDQLPRSLRNHPNGLPVATQDMINNKCLIGAGILDWKNLELDDGVHPYSKELAEKLISDPVFQIFRDACFIATSRVGNAIAEADEALAKNSGNSSDGSSATAETPQAG
jgi:hypothetical protein